MRNSVIESDLEFITKAPLPWESLKGKTVLITGAAGYLPAYMTETLLYLNEKMGLDIKVLALMRDIENASVRFAHYKKDKNLVLIRQDVCEKFGVDGGIDYIVHAASQSTPKVFNTDPVGMIKPAVIGTGNLLDLAVQKKVKCFLFFSTTGVYGHVSPDRYPLREDCFGYLDPMDLASCYIESKRMGENMCVAWMHQYGVPVKIVRPAITYGPGLKLDDGRSFSDFISSIVNNRDIELFSDGKVIRNFCYLADATVGFFTVMLKGKPAEAYNIATDHEISIIDLANLLVSKVFPERGLKVVRKIDISRNFVRKDFPRTTVDISKAKAMGWKLNFSLEEGFRRTVKSYEECPKR